MDIKSTTLTLDTLSNGCLEKIFAKITDLETQIKVSKVCQRFQDIYARIWGCNPAYLCLNFEKFHSFRDDDLRIEWADFLYFSNIVYATVQELITYDLHSFLKKVRAMQINCFPKIESFKTKYFLKAIASDMDIKILTQLMPNVKILSLEEPITGRYLNGLQELQELRFRFRDAEPNEIKTQHIPEIFENLTRLRVLEIKRSYGTKVSNVDLCCINKCSHLQVLRLDFKVLEAVLAKVLSLPQLKRLTVLLDFDKWSLRKYQEYELIYILQHNSDNVTALMFHNFAVLTNQALLEIVEACPKLEHLIISLCKGIDIMEFLASAFIVLKALTQRKCVLNIYTTPDKQNSFDKYKEEHPEFAEWTSVINLSTAMPPDVRKALDYHQEGLVIFVVQ